MRLIWLAVCGMFATGNGGECYAAPVVAGVDANVEQIGRDGSDESGDQGVVHPADQFSLAAGEGVEGAVGQNDGRADSTRFVGVPAQDVDGEVQSVFG